MKGKATLRHAGILVKDLDLSEATYQSLGFTRLGEPEHLEVRKMVDSLGRVIELVKGNWHEHICVEWYETEDGNYIEVFHDKAKI